MKKTAIWCFNGVMAVVIVVLLVVHFRRPSVAPYQRALVKVAEAVQGYEADHGHTPATLADLNQPDITSFRSKGISYTNADTEFILSITVPPNSGPKIDYDKLPKPPGGQGGHLVSDVLSMSFQKTTH